MTDGKQGDVEQGAATCSAVGIAIGVGRHAVVVHGGAGNFFGVVAVAVATRTLAPFFQFF